MKLLKSAKDALEFVLAILAAPIMIGLFIIIFIFLICPQKLFQFSITPWITNSKTKVIVFGSKNASNELIIFNEIISSAKESAVFIPFGSKKIQFYLAKLAYWPGLELVVVLRSYGRGKKIDIQRALYNFQVGNLAQINNVKQIIEQLIRGEKVGTLNLDIRDSFSELSIDAANKLVSEKILADSLKQINENFDEFGEEFFDIEPLFAKFKDKNLMIARNFWEAWIDEEEHGFIGFYPPIKKDDWPTYAKVISKKLIDGSDIDDSVLVDRFTS